MLCPMKILSEKLDIPYLTDKYDSWKMKLGKMDYTDIVNYIGITLIPAVLFYVRFNKMRLSYAGCLCAFGIWPEICTIIFLHLG